MANNFVTLLDYTLGETHVYPYPDTTEDLDAWLTENTPHRLEDCHWICTEQLSLTIHKTDEHDT